MFLTTAKQGPLEPSTKNNGKRRNESNTNDTRYQEITLQRTNGARSNMKYKQVFKYESDRIWTKKSKESLSARNIRHKMSLIEMQSLLRKSVLVVRPNSQLHESTKLTN